MVRDVDLGLTIPSPERRECSQSSTTVAHPERSGFAVERRVGKGEAIDAPAADPSTRLSLAPVRRRDRRQIAVP